MSPEPAASPALPPALAGDPPARRAPPLLALLSLLSALFVVPALAVQYWMYSSERKEALATELRRTQTRARTIAALVDQQMESSLRTVRSITSRPMLLSAWARRDLPSLDPHLAEVRSVAPEFLFVGVFELDGTMRRAVPDDPTVGSNFAYRDWYRGVTATKKPYVSEVYRTRVAPRNLVIAVAAPLVDEAGRMNGILMGAIPIDTIGRRVADTQRSVQGLPFVVDQRGFLVAGPGFVQGTVPVQAPHATLVDLGRRGQEGVEAQGAGREGYIDAVTSIPSLGWSVLYRRTNEMAFGGLYRLRQRLVTSNVYLGLVFLATAGIAFHLLRRQDALTREVRQSEERYRLLFDRSPLPLWLFDVASRRFLAVNQAAVDHYGYTRDEFLRLSVTDIRPAEDVPLFLERLDASGGSSGAGEAWRHRKKDGEVIDVEIFSHRLEVNGREASLVMVHDVSELRRHREELQTLLDSMSTMVATVAPDGRMLQLNQTARLASGLSDEDLLRTHFLQGPWWSFDPEVLQRVTRAFARACAGEAVSYEERILVFGRVTHIIFGLNPVKEQGGRVAYVVAEGRDVTALKAAEKSLRERSLELEALNQELEAFTYSVSHDLRAPLRAVAGFARILEEDHSAHFDAEGAGYLRRIIEGARQMGVLIDDLLNLSRIGRTTIERVPTDLGAIVDDAREKVSQEADGRRVDWQVQPLPQVSCDPRLVRQVFLNLLSNAVKYTRPRPEAVITVAAEERNGETVFRVRDNGVGFDMKYVHKLFGVFQRLHDGADFEGTGVGLATVQRIVHRHGGRIWAEAEPGQGATFYFTLDAGAAGQAAAAAGGSP